MTASDPTSREALGRILGFHRFLENWLRGSGDRSHAELEARLGAFDPGFLCIDPDGRRQTLGQLRRWLSDSKGSAPSQRIRIARAETFGSSPDMALIGYEEHQAGPSPNSRRAVAFFRRSAGALLWTHLSEAWIPQRTLHCATARSS